MSQKPNIAKGTRDFSSEEVHKRNYITGIIQKQFELFGFQPIETPSFERSETLMGKYGEEGDRLIFKILNNGDYLKKADQKALEDKDSNALTASISDRALRYDLTVPFARYVVQHQNKLEFPFKRYQIQPVWRADRPQKGRFREFYQCDADVIGSNSLWQEVEFVHLYDKVFTELKLEGVTIKLNNRKILSGMAEVIGAGEKLIPFTVALDKLDKIGKAGVIKEMQEQGISEEAIQKLDPIFEMKGSFKENLDALSEILKDSEAGQKGIEELDFIYRAVEDMPLLSAKLVLDVTLARGLDYYTGAIIEIAAPDSVKMGSIGGGGRYDDLTGIFGLKDMSGMGISFGLDRIYLVLEELNIFPETLAESTQAIFINFGEKEALYAMKAIRNLRQNGIRAELYPDNAKMKKQMNYADKRNIQFVILAGSKEMQEQKFTLRNMKTGNQSIVDSKGLTDEISAS